jgi:hypothetical protein
MEAFDAVHTADEPGPLKGLCTIVMPEAHLKEFAFQHAVELNSENYPLALEQSSEEPPDPQTLAAAMETFRRWPKGMRLRVHFMEGDPVVHRRLEEIALEWCQSALGLLVLHGHRLQPASARRTTDNEPGVADADHAGSRISPCGAA